MTPITTILHTYLYIYTFAFYTREYLKNPNNLHWFRCLLGQTSDVTSNTSVWKKKWKCSKSTNYTIWIKIRLANANFISDHPDFKLSMKQQKYQSQNNHIILIFKIDQIISCYKWNLKNRKWNINTVNTARYVSSSLESACEEIRSDIKLCLTTNNRHLLQIVHTCLRNCFPK